MKVSCHCRRGNERRSCLGIVAAEVCRDDAHDVPLFMKTESDAKKRTLGCAYYSEMPPSEIRCAWKRAAKGRASDCRRKCRQKLQRPNDEKSASGRAAASTTTTAGRRRRRRGRDPISDGRPDNLRQLLCSSAKRMTSRFSQVHG